MHSLPKRTIQVSLTAAVFALGLSRPLFPTVRDQTRAVVHDCEATTPVGRAIRVATTSAPDGCTSSGIDILRAFYTLSRRLDGIHIGLKVHYALDPNTTPERNAQIWRDLQRCQGQLKGFFGRYGVKLDLDIDSSLENRIRTADALVTVFDHCGHTDAGALFYDGYCGKGFSQYEYQADLCTHIDHEMGHLLGLIDEYPDPKCPYRKFISKETNPWSVMGIPQEAPDSDHYDLFPRHMRAILRPLCPGSV